MFTLTAVLDASGVQLTWTDLSTREVEFRVQRSRRLPNGVSWSDWSRIARLPANATTYVDTEAGAGAYRYRVRLLYANGADKFSAVAAVTVPPLQLEPLEQAVVDLTNAERHKAGLPPLVSSRRLTRAAAHHAANMSRFGVMAHTLPKADTPTLMSRLIWCGYEWSLAGENVSYGEADAAHIVKTWMDSPGHKANILNKYVQDIGVGAAAGTGMFTGVFYAQIFARPE